MNDRVVHVQIHGQRYAVRTDLDPQYVGELAAALDEKLRLAAREIASADPLRIAVIAALNLMDELFRARGQDSAARERDWLARTAAIERMVDAALDDHPPAAAEVAG